MAIGEYGGGYGTTGFARPVSVSPLGSGTYMGEDLSKKPSRLGAEDANKVPSVWQGQRQFKQKEHVNASIQSRSQGPSGRDGNPWDPLCGNECLGEGREDGIDGEV